MSFLYPITGDVDGTKKDDEKKIYLTKDIEIFL